MGKSKKKFSYFCRQVWRYHWYFKSLRNEHYEKKKKILLFKTRKKFTYNSSTTLFKSYFRQRVFCARYPNKFVNYWYKLKIGCKLGEFFFTRKPYYFPQKERRKTKKR